MVNSYKLQSVEVLISSSMNCPIDSTDVQILPIDTTADETEHELLEMAADFVMFQLVTKSLSSQ